jgi:hypothetical protein
VEPSESFETATTFEIQGHTQTHTAAFVMSFCSINALLHTISRSHYILAQLLAMQFLEVALCSKLT